MAGKPDNTITPRRVLLSVPTEMDADVIQSLLTSIGARGVVCADIGNLARQALGNADAIIVSEEMLNEAYLELLIETLQNQPEWSNLPVLLMSAGGTESRIANLAMQELTNVLLLDRPVRLNTLISALRMALRERGRQYKLRELMEEQTIQNQELNEYAYALTHSLKAPVRAIQNYVNFLFEDLADSLEGEQKTYLKGIKNAVVQSNKQIRDLEILYGIKNHPVNFESVDMLELLNEINSLLKNTSDQKLIFSQNWPDFRSERFLLRQILFDLINNGFKFNEANIKQVEVGWQQATDKEIEIFVRDNGIGIDPQYQGQIFDIFKRLHTQSEYDGTGIGLAVVKKAVQKISGKLRLESAVGEGSTFYINLPKSQIKNSQA